MGVSLNTAELIGMEKGEAIKKLQAAAFTARIMREDSQSFMGTMDYRMNRINLYIDNGKVTKATLG